MGIGCNNVSVIFARLSVLLSSGCASCFRLLLFGACVAPSEFPVLLLGASVAPSELSVVGVTPSEVSLLLVAPSEDARCGFGACVGNEGGAVGARCLLPCFSL